MRVRPLLLACDLAPATAPTWPTIWDRLCTQIPCGLSEASRRAPRAGVIRGREAKRKRENIGFGTNDLPRVYILQSVLTQKSGVLLQQVAHTAHTPRLGDAWTLHTLGYSFAPFSLH